MSVQSLICTLRMRDEAKVNRICFCKKDLYPVCCDDCGTAAIYKPAEAEAVKLWNRAMGKVETKEKL